MFRAIGKIAMLSILSLALFAGTIGSLFWASGVPNNTPQGPNPMDLAYQVSIGLGDATPSINVIDMNRLSVVNSFPFREYEGIEEAHFIATSPDGKYLWTGFDLGDTTPQGGHVQVLNAATGEVVNEWNIGTGVGMTITRDRTHNGRDGDGSTRSPQDPHYLFHTSQTTQSISVFNVENQEYLGSIPAAGTIPHNMDTTPDGKTLWAAGYPGPTLMSFDVSGLPDSLPAGPATTLNIDGSLLHALLVHPNGKYLFVGSAAGGVHVVDINDPDNPVVVASNIGGTVGFPHNFEISPDRKYLLVGMIGGSDDLKAINVSTLDTDSPDMTSFTIDHSVPVNGTPSHQIYTPDGKHILHTSYRSYTGLSQGELVVINAGTFEVEKILPLAERPHGLAYAGDNR
jgi:DNA-binding beta-propeller fold protein YncE